MKRIGPAVRALAFLSSLGALACGELTMASDEDLTACLATLETLGIQPARALTVDIPADPPPWHVIDWLLVAEFADADGRGSVGFKEAEAPHLLDTGVRSAASAEAIRSGLIAVCRTGGEITRYYRSIGGAAIRIDPVFAPSLRLNPFIDYIEPESEGFAVAND